MIMLMILCRRPRAVRGGRGERGKGSDTPALSIDGGGGDFPSSEELGDFQTPEERRAWSPWSPRHSEELRASHSEERRAWTSPDSPKLGVPQERGVGGGGASARPGRAQPRAPSRPDPFRLFFLLVCHRCRYHCVHDDDGDGDYDDRDDSRQTAHLVRSLGEGLRGRGETGSRVHRVCPHEGRGGAGGGVREG